MTDIECRFLKYVCVVLVCVLEILSYLPTVFIPAQRVIMFSVHEVIKAEICLFFIRAEIITCVT